MLSGPLALYGLSVQWVYTVPVTRLGGGNLRVFNRTTASSGGPATSCRRSMSTLSWFVSQCLYFLEWFVFVGFSEAVGNRCNQGLSHLSLGARGNRFVCQMKERLVCWRDGDNCKESKQTYKWSRAANLISYNS